MAVITHAHVASVDAAQMAKGTHKYTDIHGNGCLSSYYLVIVYLWILTLS